jgi:hypothetical protein
MTLSEKTYATVSSCNGHRLVASRYNFVTALTFVTIHPSRGLWPPISSRMGWCVRMSSLRSRAFAKGALAICTDVRTSGRTPGTTDSHRSSAPPVAVVLEAIPPLIMRSLYGSSLVDIGCRDG